MIELNLYQYNGRNNVVNKTLPTPVTLNGTLKQYYDVLNPVINITADGFPPYNYAYLPIFGRYYFIDDITVIDSNTVELKLSVDCLKTYENLILAAKIQINTMDNADKYVSNRNNVYDVSPNFEKQEFPNTGLLNSNGTIIMLTIKGDK